MPASASSLKVVSFFAAPVRGESATSVGGSVKLWRIATNALPLLASASAPYEDAPVTAAGTPPSSLKRYTRRVHASPKAPNNLRDAKYHTSTLAQLSHYYATTTG